MELEKSGEGESLNMHFPITIATVPFRIPNSNQQPVIQYGKLAIWHISFRYYKNYVVRIPVIYLKF